MATQALMSAFSMRGRSEETTEERNSKLYASQICARRGPTPEISFLKHIDNSRLRTVADPARIREIRNFVCAMAMLFSLVMLYGWQHFSSIEEGYKLEASKQTLEQLTEDNRQLRLSEAELSAPPRLDQFARSLGMDAPSPTQLIRADAGYTGAPVEARVQEPNLPAAR